MPLNICLLTPSLPERFKVLKTMGECVDCHLPAFKVLKVLRLLRLSMLSMLNTLEPLSQLPIPAVCALGLDYLK